MSFSLVQVEVDRSGNGGILHVIRSDFPCPDDAMERARQLAQASEKYGYNDDHGYWWFHRDEKLFRLLVRAYSPAAKVARGPRYGPLSAKVVNAFQALATSLLRSPTRSVSSGQRR